MSPSVSITAEVYSQILKEIINKVRIEQPKLFSKVKSFELRSNARLRVPRIRHDVKIAGISLKRSGIHHAQRTALTQVAIFLGNFDKLLTSRYHVEMAF